MWWSVLHWLMWYSGKACYPFFALLIVTYAVLLARVRYRRANRRPRPD